MKALFLILFLAVAGIAGAEEHIVLNFLVEQPKYRCSTHSQHDAIMTIWLDGEIEISESVYCVICYRDFLDSAIGRMEEVK